MTESTDNNIININNNNNNNNNNYYNNNIAPPLESADILEEQEDQEVREYDEALQKIKVKLLLRHLRKSRVITLGVVFMLTCLLSAGLIEIFLKFLFLSNRNVSSSVSGEVVYMGKLKYNKTRNPKKFEKRTKQKSPDNVELPNFPHLSQESELELEHEFSNFSPIVKLEAKKLIIPTTVDNYDAFLEYAIFLTPDPKILENRAVATPEYIVKNHIQLIPNIENLERLKSTRPDQYGVYKSPLIKITIKSIIEHALNNTICRDNEVISKKFDFFINTFCNSPNSYSLASYSKFFEFWNNVVCPILTVDPISLILDEIYQEKNSSFGDPFPSKSIVDFFTSRSFERFKTNKDRIITLINDNVTGLKLLHDNPNIDLALKRLESFIKDFEVNSIGRVIFYIPSELEGNLFYKTLFCIKYYNYTVMNLPPDQFRKVVKWSKNKKIY